MWVVIACCICSKHDPCICSKQCTAPAGKKYLQHKKALTERAKRAEFFISSEMNFDGASKASGVLLAIKSQLRRSERSERSFLFAINIIFLSSELGGPSGKLFRFVSCVRARGAYVRSDLGENPCPGTFPFPFSPWEVFPFPSALQGPIQLQLALSVYLCLSYPSISEYQTVQEWQVWGG